MKAIRGWLGRSVRFLAFALAVLVTAAALLAAWLSFQGRREWDRTKTELLAKGEKLSLAELLPPPVTDDQNFFADPLWREVTDLVEVDRQGVKILEPRLPKGQRRLDALDRPLTASERQALGAAFPEFPIPENATIANLVGNAYERARNSSGPERRRTAEFILTVSDFAEPVLARLRELAGRPHGRLLEPGSTDISKMGNVTNLTSCNSVLQTRVWSALVLGDSEAAKRDVLMQQRLASALAEEPLLLSFIMRTALEIQVLDTIDDGLKMRAWTAENLAGFEESLASLDFPAALSTALRGERGFSNQSLEDRQVSAPFEPYMSLFKAGNLATFNRIFQDWIDALDDSATHGLNERTISMQKAHAIKNNPVDRFRYALVAFSLPNVSNMARQTGQFQDRIQQTRIVCALERHRLCHGQYPGSLDALAPEFLPAVPRDVVTLRPMGYQRLTPDTFRLWSPGWDETNEGGSIRTDWVWGDAGR